MTPANWSLIEILLGGIICLGILIWLFFHIQERKDINRLQESVGKISEGIAVLKSTSIIVEQMEKTQRLQKLQSDIDRLSNLVDHLSTRILTDVKNEQETLMRIVQDEFERHIEKSRAVLEKSIQKELGPLGLASHDPKTSVNQDMVLNTLVDLVKHALHSMGEFQRVTIEHQSQSALHKVERAVFNEIAKVSNNVSDISDEVRALALLPSSTKS